jgi:hypothetical protein
LSRFRGEPHQLTKSRRDERGLAECRQEQSPMPRLRSVLEGQKRSFRSVCAQKAAPSSIPTSDVHSSSRITRRVFQHHYRSTCVFLPTQDGGHCSFTDMLTVPEWLSLIPAERFPTSFAMSADTAHMLDE